MSSFYDTSENLNQWLASRRWRIFVLCLPVVFSGLVLATVAGIVASRGRTELQRRYDRLARYTLEVGNYETARVVSLRGLSGAKNQRDKAEWIFYLALAMNGLGHPTEAQALVEEAAPLDPVGAGSAEAHLLVAENLLSATNLVSGPAIRVALQNSTNALAVTLDTAKRHLLSAVAIDPESIEANELLGRYYINTHQPEKARERLLKIYAAKPETALLLAIDSDSENDESGAVQWADRALTVFEHNLLQSAPRYNPEDRLGLVRALIIQRKYSSDPKPAGKAVPAAPNTPVQDSPGVWLGIVQLLIINDKYGPALQTLEQRMLVSSNAAYPPKIAELCTELARGIRLDSKDQEMTRLHFIQEGLTNAPDDLQLQLLLLQAAHGNGEFGRLARAAMNQFAADAKGETAAMWQFVLWTDYRVRGDLVEARKHLQQAYKISPQNPMVINDMAVDLATGNRKDWEHGLALIQSIADQYPYDPNLRDTRGQLLAQLGRYQEALPDLEFAIQRFQDAEDTQRALAKVYTALGIVHHEDTDRLARVQTLTLDGNYAGALKILDQARILDASPTYNAAIADVCGAWIENIPLAHHVERLQLIEKGLTNNPDNPKLQTLLLEATHLKDDSGSAARKFLDQLVANAGGESAAEWHLILGREAREKGDLTTARRHLEIALGLDPHQTQIQIEMAVELASGNPADLERGLQLINSVLEKFPDSPDFRNTRGRILARLGRNQDAVEDLKFAAERFPEATDSADARRTLAQVYDALGKPKQAEQQRFLAGLPQ